uniref:Uncharacterized protein n=1 Tax=Meloidogyne enterolobii TaxID=390850 RepID=A0A6V7VTN1_MELEN|nr:unnamed protein product [Meloidogyne enterolobii]
MELMIWRPHEFNRKYNCVNIDVDYIPIETRRSPILGSILMLLFIIYYVLYIPCMFSFWKHIDNACYKFLFYIGITDLLILWICGFETAIFGMTGVVFCSSPLLVYISGNLGNAIWAAETVAEATLAFNRCLDTISPRISSALFTGKKTWIWLSIITLYAIYWVFYMPPVLFSSLYFAWFFEPYVGGYKNVTEQYSSILHSIHNMSLAFFFPICYICFAIVLFIKKRMYGASAPNQVSNVDLVIILQIFLISVINFTAASLYDYMQYAEVNEAIIITATFSWFHVHGFPPIIYLLLNKTIRNDSKKLFYKIFKKDKVTHIHGVTVLAKNTKNRIGATNNSRMLTNTNQSRTITKQTNNLPNTISGN